MIPVSSKPDASDKLINRAELPRLAKQMATAELGAAGARGACHHYTVSRHRIQNSGSYCGEEECVEIRNKKNTVLAFFLSMYLPEGGDQVAPPHTHTHTHTQRWRVDASSHHSIFICFRWLFRRHSAVALGRTVFAGIERTQKRDAGDEAVPKDDATKPGALEQGGSHQVIQRQL